VDINLTNTSP